MTLAFELLPAILPVFLFYIGSFFSSSSIIFEVEFLDINLEDWELDAIPPCGFMDPRLLAFSKSLNHY